MQRVTNIIEPRRLLLAAAAAVGIALVAISTAWACQGLFPSAEMEFDCSDMDSDGGASGCNFHDISAEDYLEHNTTAAGSSPAQRTVTVYGSGVHNTDHGDDVAEVDLYWLDSGTFVFGLGGPGSTGQQLDADVCQSKGVKLNDTPVDVTNREFETDITVPPIDSEYADGTLRPVKAHYGANAVCMVWHHDPADEDGHDVGVGNQYDLYPE